MRLPLRQHNRAAFIFVFITVALDMLALGVMIPVLPKLVVQLEGGDIARAARITGYFGFAWATMQFICSPLMGALSDRFGRRTTILLSNFGMACDYLFMAVAPSVPWLFIGRLISGITAASYSTAAAYISDVTPEEERAGKFGMLGAAFGLGFIIGPAAGGYLGGIDLRLPFWVAAGLSFANATYGFFIIPESLPKERRRAFEWARANPLGSLQLLKTHPALIGLGVASFLSDLSHESLPSIFVLYSDYRYHWSEQTVGYMLALVGISSTVVAAGLTGKAVAKIGERRALLIGILFGVFSFIIYAAAGTGGLYLLGVPVMALWGIADPALQSYMSRTVGPTEQGELQGALSSLRGITGMMGPIIFTQLFAVVAKPELPSFYAGLPYYVAAAILLAGFAFAARATGGPSVAGAARAN